MIAIPAVDLRDGACVQLVGGSYDAERVRVPDAVGQAAAFREAGFARLHVVDLDAATGRGDNGALIDRILAAFDGHVGVGGGVRTVDRARTLVARGASSVVVGTKAVTSPAFLREITEALPGKVVLALDVKGREVVTHGWAEGSGRAIDAMLGELEALPLAGVLVTAVHVEGTLRGPDVELVRDVAKGTRHPVVASGGIGKIDDLRALEGAGAKAAVMGMALYTNAIDAREAAREFSK